MSFTVVRLVVVCETRNEVYNWFKYESQRWVTTRVLIRHTQPGARGLKNIGRMTCFKRVQVVHFSWYLHGNVCLRCYVYAFIVVTRLYWNMFIFFRRISRKCHVERKNIRWHPVRLHKTRLGSAKVNSNTRSIYSSYSFILFLFTCIKSATLCVFLQ